MENTKSVLKVGSLVKLTEETIAIYADGDSFYHDTFEITYISQTDISIKSLNSGAEIHGVDETEIEAVEVSL